jgi:hypothetical protein
MTPYTIIFITPYGTYRVPSEKDTIFVSKSQIIRNHFRTHPNTNIFEINLKYKPHILKLINENIFLKDVNLYELCETLNFFQFNNINNVLLKIHHFCTYTPKDFLKGLHFLKCKLCPNYANYLLKIQNLKPLNIYGNISFKEFKRKIRNRKRSNNRHNKKNMEITINELTKKIDNINL